MYTNSLDSTLAEFRAEYTSRTPGPAGDVGIELELEGRLSAPSDKSLWEVKGENSLRKGGLEFVLKKPVLMAGLAKALQELSDEVLSKSTPMLSIRCSTHMHVNVLKLRARDIVSALFGYYLIEEVLLATQSPNRRGNLFCLRMSDAEEIAAALMAAIQSNGLFSSFGLDQYKYAALNLASMSRFGSLEFRFLDPIVDTILLEVWARLFYNLIQNASKMTPKDLLAAYDALPVYSFLDRLLGDSSDFLKSQFSSADLNRMMHTNYDILCDLSRIFEAQRKFEMPEQFWYEDVEDGAFVTLTYKKRMKPIPHPEWGTVNFGDLIMPDAVLNALQTPAFPEPPVLDDSNF